MENVFLKLLNMSLTAGWLVLAILLLRPLLKKAPRWVSCALWGLVALRLMLPFSIESAFSLIPNSQPVPPSVVYQEPVEDTAPPVVNTPVVDTPVADTPVVDAPVVDAPVVDAPVVDAPVVDAPVVDAPSVDAPVVDTPVVDTPVVDAPVAKPTTPVVTPAPAPAKTPLQHATTAFTWVWLGGLIALLSYALYTYVELRLRLRGAVREEGNVWRSERIRTPFVLGFFRPRVYLPFGLTDVELAHVLAHERAHIARRDHWTKPFGFLLLAVYWFNPLTWVAYTLLCRDVELACDEKVVKTMAEEERRAYSTALLECSIRRLSIAACPLAFGEVGVKERVKHVLNYKKPAFWIVAVAVVACVALAVGFLTVPKPDVENPAPDSTETTTPGDSTTTTDPTDPTASAYPREDGTLTDEEKVAFNKELNFTFYRPFTQMIPDGVETLVFDTDLFATAEGRIRYAWQSAIGEETVSYIDELRADGEGETGALAMKEADFVAFYERLFGKKADMTVLARVHPEFTLRDGYIYGYHITGWGLPSFVLKAVSFKDTGTDRCVLTMDLLTSFTVVTSNGKTYADVDEEFILEYASETVLTYPAEAVYARVTLNLLASEEGYVLQNLHVTQERAANTTTPTTTTEPTAKPTEPPKEPMPVTYTFDAATGVLTVMGDGVAENIYPHHKKDKEEDDNGTVKKVVIGEGITHVKNCFNHLIMLESIQFPSTLRTIEESFIECGNTYYEGGRYVNVNIPANVKKICNQSFQCTGFESLVFNGPVEIGHVNVFDLAHFREDDTLVIPSGSVLCSAFRHTLGLTEIILESNVTFCDAKHDDSHEHRSFSTIYEEARVYAYAPTYEGNKLVGDWPDPLIGGCFGTMKYHPVVIPKGKSIEDYRDKFKKNGAFEGSAYYGWKPASNRKNKNFQCRLPKEPEGIVVNSHGNFTTSFNMLTGVLTVSGEGVVENLYPHHENDLEEYDNITVKKVVLGEGITYLKNSFNHLIMLESIQFSSTVHTIEKCFIECGNEERYLENEEWKSYPPLNVTIPATVKKIFNRSFEAAILENIVFEGPIEISCPGAFEFVTLKNRLTIPGGSVLCDAFDNVIGEWDLVLGAGVLFPDHEQHECDVKVQYSHDEDNYSFTGWHGYGKEIICLPLYNAGGEMTVEDIQDQFGGKWLPVIVPEGESITDYDGTHQSNEDWFVEGGPTAWYPWEYRDGLYPFRKPPFA